MTTEEARSLTPGTHVIWLGSRSRWLRGTVQSVGRACFDHAHIDGVVYLNIQWHEVGRHWMGTYPVDDDGYGAIDLVRIHTMDSLCST